MAYFLFDVETTGLDPEKHEICSLGGIMLDDKLNYKAKGYIKLMPQHWDRAEPEALKVNGIDPKTWEASYESNMIAVDKMIAFINKNKKKRDKVVPMGYNVSFDVAFLKSLFKQTGHEWIFNHHIADVMSWYRLWSIVTGTKVSSYRLTAACKQFNIKIPNAHNAAADVKATMELAHAIVVDLRNRPQGII